MDVTETRGRNEFTKPTRIFVDIKRWTGRIDQGIYAVASRPSCQIHNNVNN